MTAVTVQFAPSPCTKAQWRNSLDTAANVLSRDGIAKGIQIEQVFPNAPEPHLNNIFVLTFDGTAERVVSFLRKVPGIVSVYQSPSRKLISR